MMDKKDIIKIAKHAFKRGQGVPDKRLIHPRRDWAIGILIFAAILFLGGYYSASLFSKYQNIEISAPGEAGVKVPHYDESSIEATINIYNKRAAEYQALVGEVPVVDEATATTTGEVIEEDRLGEEGLPVVSE